MAQPASLMTDAARGLAAPILKWPLRLARMAMGAAVLGSLVLAAVFFNHGYLRQAFAMITSALVAAVAYAALRRVLQWLVPPAMLLVLVSAPAHAQQWGEGDVGSMTYEVRLPNSYDPAKAYPLVVYEHMLGMGYSPQAVRDLVEQYYGPAAADHPAIVVAPVLPDSGPDNNFGGVSGSTPAEKDVVRAVRQVMTEYNVDPARVYATGGSMGGLGIWQLAIDCNSRNGSLMVDGKPCREFTAFMPIDGGMNNLSGNRQAERQLAQQLKNVPVYAIHGTQDRQVPTQFDTDMQDLMAGDPTFKSSAPDVGHGTWNQYYQSSATWDWLFSQSGSTSSAPVGADGRVTPPTVSTSRSTEDDRPRAASSAAVNPGTIARSPFSPRVPAPKVQSTAETNDPPPRPSSAAVCKSIPGVQTLLPCGPMHTKGSQIVDQQNRPVRLHCVAFEHDPSYGQVPLTQQMLTLVTMGFNCLRTSFVNSAVDNHLSSIDQLLAAAGPVGLRVIVDAHVNEEGCGGGAQQPNGLWFDSGPGAGRGCDTGSNTTTDAKFVSDWIKLARHFAGNSVIVGYDLKNEPLEYPGMSQWGGGGPTDIRDMYQRVGNAILAIDPNPLIIAECPQNYAASMPEGNCSRVTQRPVTLSVPNKVVYSVHEYPTETSGWQTDCGQPFVDQMNRAWGHLITNNVAPVWIGEMATQFASPDDRCWADTLAAYLNGKAPGGLALPSGGQGVGTNWWNWEAGRPYGLMETASLTTPFSDQAAFLNDLLQASVSGAATVSVSAYSEQVSAVSATVFPAAALSAEAALQDQQQDDSPSPTPAAPDPLSEGANAIAAAKAALGAKQ